MGSQKSPSANSSFDPYEGDFEKSDGSSPESVFFTPNPRGKVLLMPTKSTDTLQSIQSSLSLSRSSSTKAFSPGPHRRSHPNLQHLSLAPLTPKYPINPSDYDAYFNPETSQLHTSTSLSHIAAPPSPGGILTNSPARSRANSRTRNLKRKAKSTVVFKADQSVESTGDLLQPPHGALTSEGFGGRIASEATKSNTKLRLKPHNKKQDSSWLVQTGLALTEGSRESKGQTWLVKRASSTSLHTPVMETFRSNEGVLDRPFRSPYASGRNTPNRSRRNSRDRRRSRRELAMTPVGWKNSGTQLDRIESATDDPALSRLITTSSHRQGYSGADWVDSQTQAEIAAELEMEIANELTEGDRDAEWWREDRYGMLDFEGQFDSDEDDEKEDEEEVQKAVRERGFGVGRWIDGVVDVLLKLDDDDDERDLEAGFPRPPAIEKPDQATSSTSGKDMENKEKNVNEVAEDLSDDLIEAAPENPTSVWEDVAWFSRLVLRTARS